MDEWTPLRECRHLFDWPAGVVPPELESDPDPDSEPGGLYDNMMYALADGEWSDALDMVEIGALVEAGEIVADTQCWTEGMDEWVPFEDCKYLFAWPS